jgi:hypothetical protein
MYKIRNQQRRNPSFKHLQAVLRKSKALFSDGQAMMSDELIVKTIEKIREEAAKAGQSLIFNLRLNFFANYSTVV